MAIAINGSGTVTGISVGGLPDGIVDNDMIANSTIAEGKLANDNTPMWFARLNGNYIHNSTNTWLDAPLATELFDTDSAFNTSTYKFTVPSGKAGKYLLYYQHQANDNPDDGENIQGRVLKNGSTLQYSNLTGFSSASNQTNMIGKSWVEPLAVGDELLMQLYHHEGGAVTYNQYNTYFGGYRLIGG